MKSYPPLLSVYTLAGEKGRGKLLPKASIYNYKRSHEVPVMEAFKQGLDDHIIEVIPVSEKHG